MIYAIHIEGYPWVYRAKELHSTTKRRMPKIHVQLACEKTRMQEKLEKRQFIKVKDVKKAKEVP